MVFTNNNTGTIMSHNNSTIVENETEIKVANENSIKLSIVKRTGSIVPFKIERIQKAIEAAFRDTKKTPSPKELPKGVVNTIDRLTQIVVAQVKKLGEKGVALTVEGIQDLVEVTLMKNGFHDVARDYIIYRDQHKVLRENSPENIRILRSDGATLVKFNPIKISHSIQAAMASELESNEALTDEINDMTAVVTKQVIELHRAHSSVTAQFIQEAIEEVLLEHGHLKAVKQYIISQVEGKAGTARKSTTPEGKKRTVTLKTEDGQIRKISEKEIRKRLEIASRDYLDQIDFEHLVDITWMNFYDEMPEKDMQTALVMGARALVEKEPCYSFITAQILLDHIYQETIESSLQDRDLEMKHTERFATYIKNGITYERLNPELLDFDLDQISAALCIERDQQFQYLGLQNLYDRYFIHHRKRRLETPQYFWMRVAMGLALREEKKEERAIEFYNLLSEFYYSSATPTLFNSGTTHSQLSSCFLSTISDDLSSIFKVISDDAQLSKWAGGLGNDWTNVRATGSLIKGTNGESQGIIPFLKVANDTAVAVNQGGKRKGAMCAYLETWHLDIEDFLELRKNTGDDRRRTHDMNTANWIPDLFMKRVERKEVWTLFSPSDVPDLHDLFGSAFEKRYMEYEAMIESGQITHYKKIPAQDLWRKMLSMLFETGHPWITFKDPSNVRSAQDHVGVVHSSNLCTEILLNTSSEETAVCNLGSVNLTKHVRGGKLDEERFKKTIFTAIRMLDNVIDINFYPIKEAETANLRHRAIGLGMMGFQDVLYDANISFASHEAVELSDAIAEMYSYYAILASSKLAKERGSYSSYKGSKWERGILPIDSIALLEQERGGYMEMDSSAKMDWSIVRDSIKKHGMRNCQVMAIAPTATIANILGVTQSIEPSYNNLFVKSNLSGEFTITNDALVAKLKILNLWDDQMLDDLKYYDGSIQEIDRIPDEVKQIFLAAFEIDPDWVIECASRRQKWIDQGQSVNLYLSSPDGKKLNQMYLSSWRKGLKTNYYLRSLAATQIEKSAVDINKRGLQPKWMKSKSASSSVQTATVSPKVCSLEEGCESCQ